MEGYLLFWMRYVSEIFWRHSWDVSTLVSNKSEFLVCLSVCQLAQFFTEITQILGYLQFWIRYLSEIFGRHSWDVGTLFSNRSKFLVCLSVCLFAYFFTEIRQIYGYLKFWMRYLLEIFWRHSWDVDTLFSNKSEFLICLSVCQLAYFLTEIRQMEGYLQFWMRLLSDTFWELFLRCCCTSFK